MQSIPVQSWTFEQESIIRIGRSTDNHVILYSAVVSRHHVEIRKIDSGWEIVNLGANGTYVDGRRITQVPVEDGVIIRLARSGPNVQIHLGSKSAEPARDLDGESTVGQRANQETEPPAVVQSPPSEFDEVAVSDSSPHSAPIRQPKTGLNRVTSHTGLSQSSSPLHIAVDKDGWTVPDTAANEQHELSECCHRYIDSDQLFCLDCGKPLRILGTVGEYRVVKTLEQDDLGVTQLGWQEGQTFVLRTLNPGWVNDVETVEQFQQEAEHFLHLNHPVLPRFVKVFMHAGQPYLVMEPVYGPTLQQVAQNGEIAQNVAIAHILTLCDLLDYLHQQTPPIVHQDIKPENLIQRPPTAAAKIVLVGLTPCRSLITAIQNVSTGYTAPEQQHGQAFPSSDLYALGLTLVYLLTGKPPNTFYAQREQGFRLYPEYIPNLSPDLVPILRCLTNPNPDERYTTANELAADLLQVTSKH